MSKTISKFDDVIDSRDVIARIEELRGAWTDPDTGKLLEDMDDDDAEELKALEALAEQGEGYASDWRHGETLIRDSHFEDYARQLAEDTGAIPSDAKWPCTCIDWEQAASELQQDYTSIDFDGETFWVR